MKIICKGCRQTFMPFLPHNHGDFGHSCIYCGEINTYEDNAKRLLLCFILLMKGN